MKYNLFTGSDLVRILYGYEVYSEIDLLTLSLVIFRASDLMERKFGFLGYGMEERGRRPLWVKVLHDLAKTKWATDWRQRHPLETAEIEVALTLHDTRAAQEDVAEAASTAQSSLQ